MSYSVIVPMKIAATDVGSYNRSVICTSADIENGSLLVLNTGKSSTAGEEEVWLATQPVTATLAAGLWMAYSPEIVLTVSGSNQFKGIDPDPRNFINKQSKAFDAFKLSIGDVFMITDDGLTGAKGVNTYAVAADGDWQLNWNATAVSGLSCKLLGTSYISIPSGTIETQRVTAYQFEVVALA